MLCPKCGNAMTTSSSGATTTSSCVNCSGTWIGGRSLAAFFSNYASASNIEEAFEEIAELEFSGGERACPACAGQRLKAVQVDGTELDYCTSCKGLFFDQGELETVFPRSRQQQAEASDDKPGGIDSIIDSILSWLGGDRR